MKLKVLVLFGALVLLWAHREAIQRAEGPTTEATFQDEPGLLVVDLVDGTSPEDARRLLARHNLDLDYTSLLSMDEALMVGTVASLKGAIERLAKEPLVEVVEPAMEFTASAYPNDPLWPQQWNLHEIGVEVGWRFGGGQGCDVAVVDTGVTLVEDLAGVEFRGGHSFVTDSPDPVDDHGHGTHVAGTIAQQTHNGVAVAGVAPHVALLAYKVLDGQGQGRSDWIAAAIDEAADQGADVINLSLGGPHSNILHRAAERAVARGVVVVAAAGNTGRDNVSCPAHAKGVLGVGALGPDGLRAPYSSFGSGVEIAAPGGDLQKEDGGVLQQTIDGKGGSAVQAFQGTSMAAPHVSGAAAVLLGRGIAPRHVEDLILRTASPTGLQGAGLGRGRLNLAAAIRHALLTEEGLRFGVAALLAGLLANMAGLAASSSMLAALSAGFFSSGLFFLPLLPIPPGTSISFLSRGILQWPSAFWGGDLVGFPLWLSSLFPVAVGFLFGPSLRWGVISGGLCVAFGCALLQGAANKSLDPWWFGLGLDTLWLSAHGTLALLAAMAVFGMQSMRRKQR